MTYWAVVKGYVDPSDSVIALCRTETEAAKLVEMLEMAKSQNYTFGYCKAELYPPACTAVSPNDNSVTSWYCNKCQVEVYSIRCKHCGKSETEES